MTFKRAFIHSFIISLGLASAFLAGFYFRVWLSPRVDQFPIFLQAYAIMQDNALNPLPDPPVIEYGLIRGMLQAYGDPYSVFVEPVQHELETNSLQGSFGGIGARFGRVENGTFIIYPYPDGPAARAGVFEGDQLQTIDDLIITPETSLEAVEAASRGLEGQVVRLVIHRPPEGKLFEFHIKRESIPLPSVTWHLDPAESSIGVIEINIIAASTPDEIEKAVSDLQSRGASEFILDLRNNGGGLLSSGVDTARLFLKDGVVIRQYFRGKDTESFEVKQPGSLSDLPLAVLVNQGTASAAEIIAGALQAHGRAIIIGEPTFGKFSIQYVFDLADGSSLHVTAGRWWIPARLDQQFTPPEEVSRLQPDYEVTEMTGASDPFLSAAVQVLIDSP
jgi:carboxyl-terminal processing protease